MPRGTDGSTKCSLPLSSLEPVPGQKPPSWHLYIDPGPSPIKPEDTQLQWNRACSVREVFWQIGEDWTSGPLSRCLSVRVEPNYPDFSSGCTSVHFFSVEKSPGLLWPESGLSPAKRHCGKGPSSETWRKCTYPADYAAFPAHLVRPFTWQEKKCSMCLQRQRVKF